MCTGIELALLAGSAALSGGGALMANNQANKQAAAIAKARNDVLNRTLAKNDRIAADSRSVFDRRRQDVEPEAVQQQQQDATTERTDIGESAVTAPVPGSIPLSGSAPNVVTQAFAKRMSDAVGKGKSEAQALGRLGGFGDMWFGQGIGNAAAGREMGVNQNFASGNTGILPYLQDFAEIGATKPMSPIPGIMQAAGQAMGSFAGGGGTGGIPGRVAKQASWKKPLGGMGLSYNGTGFLS